MKTPEERGPIGAWAYTARQNAELSVEEVCALLKMRGITANPATLRGIESGSKKPGRALLSALSEVYGVHPPTLNGAQTTSDYSELVAAQDRTTKAIERNTAVLARLLAEILKTQAGTEWTAEEEAALAEAEAVLEPPQPRRSPAHQGRADAV